VICSGPRSPKPRRIAVFEDESVVGVFPSAKTSELMVPRSPVLLGGTIALFVNLASLQPRAALLNVDTLALDEHSLEKERPLESWFLGLDVDSSGRYALIATKFDDFPQICIYDHTKRKLSELDCTDLIDAQIDELQWLEAPSRIQCRNTLDDQISILIVERKKVRWG
jgi:hypothetical protein